MQYSISQMAEKFGLQPHTLRFYEKEGLLSPARSENGIRYYTDQDAARMEMAMCLKSTGMPLKDIRRYFGLVEMGDGTLQQRLDIFTEHRRHVLDEIEALQKNLVKIEWKIKWCKEALESK